MSVPIFHSTWPEAPLLEWPPEPSPIWPWMRRKIASQLCDRRVWSGCSSCNAGNASPWKVNDMTSTQAPSPPPAGPPPVPSADRLRLAVEQRAESDYIFEPWSALGWTILTLGVYGLYVFYQLMRRMRDHNRRRLEFLDAAGTLAWERAAVD